MCSSDLLGPFRARISAMSKKVRPLSMRNGPSSLSAALTMAALLAAASAAAADTSDLSAAGADVDASDGLEAADVRP